MFKIIDTGDLYLVRELAFDAFADPGIALASLDSLVGSRVDFLPNYVGTEYVGFQPLLEFLSASGYLPGPAADLAIEIAGAWEAAFLAYASAVFAGYPNLLRSGVVGAT
ncbi:hypothetical protein nbrc107696_42620 [Gordonia spumicola]|uniref:Uncharacterized protein n=1 Tax=Gordonia spumicola TaxID=589161 RepID=A0A7I9VET8_9ACTN|nr:hypothetical protein [Gordonia spumicola]GEE03816.1 hypothetical protein nbrc107696_42620 [Gordonia spumicola]